MRCERRLEAALTSANTAVTAPTDPLGILTPAGYVRERLEDQRSFYQRRAGVLECELRKYLVLIWVAGVAGSLLAAASHELWIALTAAVAAAFAAFLQYENVERTLAGYNQAAAELANVAVWWTALSADEQANQDNIDKLVDSTENVVAAENASWLQQMQETLKELRDRQAKDSADRSAEPKRAEPEVSAQMDRAGMDAATEQGGAASATAQQTPGVTAEDAGAAGTTEQATPAVENQVVEDVVAGVPRR
jgi:hypothetical protein